MATAEELGSVFERLGRANRDLQVEANAQLTIDGVELAVSSRQDGKRLRIHASSVGALVSLREQRGRLTTAAELLDAMGLTAELCTGDATIAVIGADVTPGPASAALFSGPVEISATGLLAGLLRLR